MRGVHIGHDGYVDDQVTMSCNTILGGHSIIMKGANIGLGSSIHQFRVVGAYAMIGMMSNVVRSIPPFVIAVGNPAKPTKINAIGMQRGGVADLDVASAMQWMERGMDDSALSPHLKQIMDRWHSMYGACGK